MLFTGAIAQELPKRIDPRWSIFVKPPEANRSVSLGTHSSDSARHYVARIALSQRGQYLSSHRIQIVRRLDALHAIIRYEDSQNSAAEALIDTQPANTLWKLSPPLLTQRDLLSNSPTVKRFTLQGHDYAALKRQLARRGVRIRMEYPRTHTCIVETDYTTAYLLLSLPELTFISETATERHTESLLADPDMYVNRINQVHHDFPALDGSGQTLSIKEEAYDPTDIDLRGRHRPSPEEATIVSDHATDMATLSAGGGNTAPTSRGVARGAQLTAASFANLFPDTNYNALGVSVQNHSYGTQVESFYGAEAQAYDQSTQDIPTLLHVFSVGNSGSLTDSLGTYRTVPGFANLTGNYKMAKNVLTVGAVDQQIQIDSLISRGPAHDGRIKPELVAFSTDGSSGAAALVSGTATLLQQAHQQLYDVPAPSALLRAILLNSAEDVGTVGPDFFSGYGNLNARRALQTLRDGQYFAIAVEGQQDTTLTITLPADARNLRVTLVWNDPAAAPNSSPVLTNDLDLRLAHPATARRWYPWVLNTYPHADSLRQPAQPGVDHLNTIEQITLARPSEGSYQIQVGATSIPTGVQEAYVAVQWDTANHFQWTSPTSSDNLPQDGLSSSYFRWENTYDNAVGQLAVSFDQGGSWQTIEEEVDLSAEFYAWEPPYVLALTQARMIVNGTTYLSDTFTISYSLQPTVGFSCGDSTLLQWNRVEEAVGYTLYTLGEQYVEARSVTTDTFAVLRSAAGELPWYAVAPRLNQAEGARSLSVNPQAMGTGCYVAGFLAGINDSSEVNLLLDLGTTYQVARVEFERWDGTAFQPLVQVDEIKGTLQEYTDTTALQGRNEYRARLQLANGGEVLTESASVYYLTQQPVLLFPNPVSSSQLLSIYTRTFGQEVAYLTLYNEVGQPVLRQDLPSEQEAVSIQALLPGIYAYVVSVGNERFRGKIIVQH